MNNIYKENRFDHAAWLQRVGFDQVQQSKQRQAESMRRVMSESQRLVVIEIIKRRENEMTKANAFMYKDFGSPFDATT